jgi:hypothetical protein
MRAKLLALKTLPKVSADDDSSSEEGEEEVRNAQIDEDGDSEEEYMYI